MAQVTFKKDLKEMTVEDSETNSRGHSHAWEAARKNRPFKSQQGGEGCCHWQSRRD